MREIGGLALIESGTEEVDWDSYGTWMEYSAAFVWRSESLFGTDDPNEWFGVYAFGSLSDAPLPEEGTATWAGAMFAADRLTAARYAGNAALVAMFSEYSTVDVSFTEIADVETGDAREDITFNGVDLITDDTGTHRMFQWAPGDVPLAEAPIYIDGQLFGPDLAEATGVFGHNELVGAFGARRQE